MKTIGIIGGLSWESSDQYYQITNRKTRQELGGNNNSESLMYTFNFREIEELQHAEKWEELTRRMIQVAQKLETGGVDFIVICSNTMHKMADEIAAAIRIPLLHIADPTGEAIVAAGFKTVGLLGTAFTMEQEFYRSRLEKKFDLKVITPDVDDRAIVHATIYNELVKGIISDVSRNQFKDIIRKMADKGAEAIILGCTEIMMLISERDSPVPVYDTTALHARGAVRMALTP